MELFQYGILDKKLLQLLLSLYNHKLSQVLATGYDNGGVKVFDLKQNMLMWETNLKNGVYGLEFDRKYILMNKLRVATLEGKFTFFNLRTLKANSAYDS